MKNSHSTVPTRVWLLLFLVCCSAVLVNAQTVPPPLYEFPLDYKNITLYKTQTLGRVLSSQGDKGGVFAPHVDRFGREAAAVLFKSPHSYIAQRSDATPQSEKINVTISFWTYLNKTYISPSGPSPYDPAMRKQRFFSLTTDHKSGGLAKLRDNTLLGVERTVATRNGTKPWYLWLYEPAMMEQKGWYQVVAVMAVNYTKVYVYKPDGSSACSYNYMGNNFPKKIVIGNKANYATGETVEPASVIDDFKIWNVALTEQQIEDLHRQDKSTPSIETDLSNVPLGPKPPKGVVHSTNHAKVLSYVLGGGATVGATGMAIMYRKKFVRLGQRIMRSGYRRLVPQVEVESMEMDICK